MNKSKLFFTVIFGFTITNIAFAVPNLTGKTFVMSGKLTGSASASCSPGGTRNVPIKATRGLHATLTFNPGNVFSWSDDGLSVGASTNIPGFWTRKRNLIDLEFDDDSQSGIKAVGQVLPTALSSLGVTSTIKNTKYNFFATTNANGNKLIVTESGGFKVRASGVIRGTKVSCTVRINLKRVYKGVSVP